MAKSIKDILQNVFNIPLALSALSINFIEPHDDPMLGLWAIGFILLLIPTAIGYLQSLLLTSKCEPQAHFHSVGD